MKRFFLIFALVFLSEIGQAQIGKYQNFCEYGQQLITLSGMNSSTIAQAPHCKGERIYEQSSKDQDAT